MCLSPVKKKNFSNKKNWLVQPVNSIKNLISNSYILDRRRIKKKLKSVKYKNFEVRLAKNFKDIDVAQNLRYRVFYEELKAKPTIKNILYEKDFDELDPFCDHLLVIDHNKNSKRESIVGTYRLIRRPMTQIHGKFYTEGEFDIKKPVYLVELKQSLIQIKDIPEYQGISKYPSVRRDLALILDEKSHVNEIVDYIILYNDCIV